MLSAPVRDDLAPLRHDRPADLPDGIAPGEPRLARHDDGPSSS